MNNDKMRSMPPGGKGTTMVIADASEVDSVEDADVDGDTVNLSERV
jgi:hypothetical protein